MTKAAIELIFGFLLYLLVTSDAVYKWVGIERQKGLCGALFTALPVAVILFTIGSFWFCSWKLSQAAPHHITQTLGTKVIADFWTTNRYYVTTVCDSYEMSNGLVVLHSRLQTNSYW